MLSVIIPSRNEQYLSKTVDDIFAKACGKIDTILSADCEDNWIVIPRRFSLQAEDWTIKPDRPNS